MAYFSIVAVLVLPFVCGANGLDPTSQQFAYHRLQAGESAGYYGVSVTMDVYALSLSSNQYSSAGVHISSGEDGAADQNVIKIGSEVYPHLYGGDSRTHLGAFWTCAVGFQPEAGAALVLGDIIEPLSSPNGTKQTITIKLLKPTLIGRYPKSLFPGGLADRATHIHIGGVVASRTRDLIIDQNGQASLLSPNLSAYMTRADTYSISSVINGKFFYGGPFQLTA
ncbi:hypothetical protein VPH35_024650 [Triticum aestivum]